MNAKRRPREGAAHGSAGRPDRSPDYPTGTTPARRQLIDLLGRLDGARIPGGCDDCDAFQTSEPVTAGVWKLTVHHDDGCRWLARRGAA